MRLVKEIVECLPKICHNIALISTELYYILFNRVDALEAQVDELKVILNYDIDNLREVNRYYKEVADKVYRFSAATNLYMGAIKDLEVSKDAIDLVLDNFKEELDTIITEETKVYPEGLLEVTDEIVKNEEVVQDLNKEADKVAEEKAKEIAAKREALEQAKTKEQAAERQAAAAKKSLESLQKELDQARAQADSYKATLEAEAAKGEPGTYYINKQPLQEFFSVSPESQMGAVEKFLKKLDGGVPIPAARAEIMESILEKTNLDLKAAYEISGFVEEAKSYLNGRSTPEEVKGYLKELIQETAAALEKDMNAALKMKTRKLGATTDELLEAVVSTAQERIDAANAAAGIQGALERITELENQVGDAKNKYEKTMRDVVNAKSEMDNLANTISRDTAGMVEDTRRDGGDSGDSGSGGGGGRDKPRGGDTSEHRDDKAEREKEAREKLERDIEEGKYDKDIQDEYDRTHQDNDDDNP